MSLGKAYVIPDSDLDDYIVKAKEALSDVFRAEPHLFHDFEYLSDGISNISCRFQYRNRQYIVRLPREDVIPEEKYRLEHDAYRLLKHSGVSCTDKLIHFDIKKGIKITEFIGNAYYPDANNEEHISRCMKLLKSIHSAGIRSSEYFDIAETLIATEEEKPRDQQYKLEDYQDMRKAFFKIYERLPARQEAEFCHIDPIRYNFLLSDAGDYLIDFEYSRMCNPAIDLASFAIYNNFGEAQIRRMMELYYERAVTQEEFSRLYSYLALNGLYSAVWYRNRLSEDREMEKAMYRAYAYAVKYSRKVLGH